MTTQKPKRVLRKWGKFPAKITLYLSEEQKQFYQENDCAQLMRDYLDKVMAQADKEGADNER